MRVGQDRLNVTVVTAADTSKLSHSTSNLHRSNYNQEQPNQEDFSNQMMSITIKVMFFALYSQSIGNFCVDIFITDKDKCYIQ